MSNPNFGVYNYSMKRILLIAFLIPFFDSKAGVVGYSRDGKYLAIEQDFISNSEAPESNEINVGIIDVAKNSFKEGLFPIVERGSDISPNKDKWGRLLKKYDIDQKDKGNVVVNRLESDVSGPVFRFAYSGYGLGYLDDTGRTFTPSPTFWALEMGLKDGKGPRCGDSKLLSLELQQNKNLKDPSTIGEKQLLQKDLKVPESRSCPHLYRLSQVRVRENSILIVVNSYSSGHEGPTVKELFVTALVDWKWPESGK